MSLIRDTAFEKVNALTKYPSIPTYHPMRDGRLLDEAPVAFTGNVTVTEKIDGTNARIILDADGDWIVGSRENLLAAKGDRIGDPSMGIVAGLRSWANRAADVVRPAAGWRVLYGEFYGAKVGSASKEYAGATDLTGWRIFDAVDLPDRTIYSLLPYDAATLSAWREAGRQPFVSDAFLVRLADDLDAPLTPRLETWPAEHLPRTIAEAASWIAGRTRTEALLSADGGGTCEGVVIRSTGRSAIAKLRHQDYARALRPGRR